MHKIILIIFLLGVLFFGYYVMIFEPSNIKIEKQVVAIQNLPQTFDGLKIVQLSDFHSYWFGSRERKVLEMLEEIEPDFVFITGDSVDPITKLITDRDLSSVKIFWQELGKKYQGRIFGVLGNHDTGMVKNYLEESGIPILDNENRRIWIGQEFIYLIGVDDPWTGRDDLPKAMAETENDIPKILLAHGPEIMARVSRKEIDLILVGHTHGGQVNIPFFGRLIQPLSRYGRKYTRGLFKVDSTPLDSKHLTGYTYLYVNRGIGTSIIPARFNCPPEITLIELRK